MSCIRQCEALYGLPLVRYTLAYFSFVLFNLFLAFIANQPHKIFCVSCVKRANLALLSPHPIHKSSK